MTNKKTKPRASSEPRNPNIVPPEHQVERAAGDLRRGMPVLIRGINEPQGVIAVSAETVADKTLAALIDRFGAPLSVLTHDRAATLKIPLYTADIVLIPQQNTVKAEELRALADPTADLDYPLKGPFQAFRGTPPEVAGPSVRLAKLAGLLPATAIFILGPEAMVTAKDAAITEVAASDIDRFEANAAETLQLITRASVPLGLAEDAELAAFRPQNGGQEHYAVIIGKKGTAAINPPGPVLARLHSECFTGDFLGSLKCDCGDQLRGAVASIAAAGGGVLLYLAQEGRGIGLMNKLRAYRLQDEGFDTMEANRRLGFADDERLYDIAARMLTLLGYQKVRLMTNNPHKVRALEKAGVQIVERVPHSFPDNVHNRDYLRAKAEKGGHLQ